MPTRQEVHVDTPMTEFSLRYSNPDVAYIAEKVMPPVYVGKESDKWFVYDKANLRAEADGPRGDKEPAGEVSYSVSTDSYTMHVYSLKDLVTDRMRANADRPLDPEQDAVSTLTDNMLVNKEIRAAAILFSSSYLTKYTTLSGTDQWSDYAGSNPFTDIQTGHQSVQTYAGMRANACCLGRQVWDKLKYHSTLVERIKYVSPNGITLAQFADLIEIPAANVFVGDAMYNAIVEGQTEGLLSYIWGKHFSMFYKPTTPTPRSVICAATIRNRQDRRVTTWRSNDPEGDYYKVEMAYVQKLVTANAGYLIVNAVG